MGATKARVGIFVEGKGGEDREEAELSLRSGHAAPVKDRRRRRRTTRLVVEMPGIQENN